MKMVDLKKTFPQLQNHVVVIGADHHNTLSVVRSLGENNCSFTIIIHTTAKTINSLRICISKYNKGRTILVREDEASLISCINSIESNESHMTILFPCSDFAAYCIDKEYTILKKKFIVPSFNNSQYSILTMMDKNAQYYFANAQGLRMAKTWKITDCNNITEDIVFPCILKPTVSAEGRKADIRVCKKRDELENAVKNLFRCGYESLIVQQYLNKKYEVCGFGYVAPEGNHEGYIVKKLRETPPPAQGSTLYAQFISESLIKDAVDLVLNKLIQCGYSGLYDIEMIICDDGIYLNEINFRYSGCGFGCARGSASIPYRWCLAVAGVNIMELHLPDY